jgi:hypothetical protein
MENTHHTLASIFVKVVERVWDLYMSGYGVASRSLWLLIPWRVFCVITWPPIVFVYILTYFILTGIRLAIGNADRVIFVLAASFLTYYQVPHTAFYVYISVVLFTGSFQILKEATTFRLVLLQVLSICTLGKSEALLLRYSSFHFRNPFTRRYTESEVIYVPVGSSLPDYSRISYFQFEVSNDFNAVVDHELTVGDCRLIMKTIQGGVEQSIRSLQIEAPWGVDRITFEMDDDNLGRLIGYLRSLMGKENKARQLICSGSLWLGGTDSDVYAMTLSETIKHFNSGAKLVKLENCSATPDGCFEIL